jgi:hypothetical protein
LVGEPDAGVREIAGVRLAIDQSVSAITESDRAAHRTSSRSIRLAAVPARFENTAAAPADDFIINNDLISARPARLRKCGR